MSLRIVGIDPGLDGGLALLTPDGLLLEVMPTLGSKRSKGGKTAARGCQREVDAAKVAELLRAWNPTHAILEKVGARPGQGVRSMFTFGVGVGVVKGVLGTLGIALTEAAPQAWQKAVCKGLALGDPKAAALLRARQLFPRHSFVASERSREPHKGLVDAVLLAEYGRILRAEGGP